MDSRFDTRHFNSAGYEVIGKTGLIAKVIITSPKS